jgi:RNA polymerase subunit RPABC4/transcription elongation factor Spt4
MAFETREQVLEKVMEMDKPLCPHCGQPMSLWEVPPVSFSDGLGWGEPFLFVCFNDECSLYKEGWENIEENFGQTASYRCMAYPSSGKFECMPVFSPMGGQGQVIDDQVVAQEEMLKENIKKGFSILADCYVSHDGPAVLRILMDSGEPERVRMKAAEMIGDIGELEAVEPLQNCRFGNALIQDQVDESVKKIHQRFFTRECPFCAEIIKQRAKVCKHCGKDIAGQ